MSSEQINIMNDLTCSSFTLTCLIVLILDQTGTRLKQYGVQVKLEINLKQDLYNSLKVTLCELRLEIFIKIVLSK